MSYISAISITTCAIYDCEGLSHRHCPCVWFSSSLVTTYAHNRAQPNGIRDLVRRSCNPATCKHRGKMWMGCQELQRCDVQLLFISRGLCICGHTSCSWGDSRGIELIKKHRIQSVMCHFCPMGQRQGPVPCTVSQGDLRSLRPR